MLLGTPGLGRSGTTTYRAIEKLREQTESYLDMRWASFIVLMFFLLGAELPEEPPLPAQNPRMSNEPDALKTDAGAQNDRDAKPAPDEPPLPAARPEIESAPHSGAPGTDDEGKVESREPPGETEGEDGIDVGPEQDSIGKSPEPTIPPVDPEKLAQCIEELRSLDVRFETLPPQSGIGDCGIGAPLRISTLGQGVKLVPASKMRCETALATAKWIRKGVLPAVSSLGENVSLTAVRHASSYICRQRNNGAGGKISEHAKGNAIDIQTFEFEGRDPIPILPRAGKGTIEEAFQRAVRGSACLHFTTVLGPGSDDYHDDHLHLDIAERTNRYRLCQ